MRGFRVGQRLRDARFRSVLWLLPIALTLHNVAEWIWLPGWAEGAGLPGPRRLGDGPQLPVL